jgi:hypothetical protein
VIRVNPWRDRRSNPWALEKGILASRVEVRRGGLGRA